MINRALKLLRTYHQLSQTELATRLEVSNSYLCEIEKGIKTPGLDLLKKYADTFKMPVSSILMFSEGIEASHPKSEKLRVTAASKVLRLLEWIDEREAISSNG